MGLLLVGERDKESTLNAMEAALADPLVELVHKLEGTSWDFHSKTEEVVAFGAYAGERDNLKALFDAVMKAMNELSVFFASSQNEHTKVNPKTYAMFFEIRNRFERIDEKLDESAQAVNSQELRELAHNLHHLINQLAIQVDNQHQIVLNQLLSKSRREGEQRDIVILFILLDIVALFWFLLMNKQFYLNKMKLVQTAEHYSALFASTLQSTRVGVMIRNMQLPDQPVVYINNAFLEMTGYDLNIMEHRQSDSLLGPHTDSSVARVFRDTVARGESGTFDLLIYRKDGSSFWSEWHINPLRDSSGALTHYVSLLNDITSVRQTQEALLLAKEQAERASAIKTNFLATMSHEIRTPINGLLGVLDLLGDTGLQGEQRRLLDLATNAGRSLHSIINDILDYAKMEAGKTGLVREPFSLRTMVRDILDLITPLAKAKNLELSCELADDVADVCVSDSGRIRQILMNLLSNAVKFTDQGQVGLRVRKLMTQEAGAHRIDLVRFEVADTGIGISAADQDKLFKEFSQIEHAHTRRFSGTGLGLAITRRLVLLFNGEIGVSSKPGVGSKFWFILPLPVDAKDAAPILPRPKPMPLSCVKKDNVRLLLVEDNETNRLVASRYLDKAGFAHDLATTGLEAVAMAKAKAYHLILMDVSMPVMDGFEACRQIRALGGWAERVPIVAMTAHVMEGDRERCLAAGMNDHLGKPMDFDALVKKIEAWLVDDHLQPNAVNDGASLPLQAPKASEGVASLGAQPAEAKDEPANQGRTLPDCDARVLQRLVDDLGENAMLRITQAFLDSLGPRMDALSLQEDSILDLVRVREVAHTLKSSSANCGMAKFSDLMANIEGAAAANDKTRVETFLEQLEPVYTSARQALEQERQRFPA